MLKKDLKIKLIGLYKVKWRNVLLAVVQFAGIVVCSILTYNVCLTKRKPAGTEPG